MTKKAGSGSGSESGSISQRHGSADPDPDPPKMSWICNTAENTYYIMYLLFKLSPISLTRLYNRVQWFWLFFTFWGITTHPWHPKGPRIWKLSKKIFQLHSWPAETFDKNRKMRFFGMISKFNVRSPVWQIFTIFSACFIYGILNTHIKF